jgi:hypothetical protein
VTGNLVGGIQVINYSVLVARPTANSDDGAGTQAGKGVGIGTDSWREEWVIEALGGHVAVEITRATGWRSG